MDVFLVKHYVPAARLSEDKQIIALEQHKEQHSIKGELMKKTDGLVFEFFFSSNTMNITIERIKEQ